MVGNKKSWKAWLYLSPAIILLLIFTVWPILNSLIMAFSEGYNSLDAVGGETFKFGLGNFFGFTKVDEYGNKTEVAGLFNEMSGFLVFDFTDGLDASRFGLGSVLNTMLLTVITVPISTLLALLIAVALNSIKPLQKLYQTIFFLPYVTNSIAIGMVFAAMFNVEFGDPTAPPLTIGIVNMLLKPILGIFNINYIDWMSPQSSYISNIIVTSIYIIWNALPFKILILMGGLQSISKQYYDAAKVDGTSKFRVFTRITVPLLSPMLSYVIITSFISGFKEYSSIVGLFDELKAESGELVTMVGNIYQFMRVGKEGQAAAAALVLFAIIFAVTMVNLYVSKKNTHY